MKIGITERGDAGLDMGWAGKLKTGRYDGAVLITKNITPAFIENALECHKAEIPLVIHATCTGWGGTIVEPGVPFYKDQVRGLKELCREGFPLERCVLRVDPILPVKEGIDRAREVITHAREEGLLPTARVRISVLDEYRHVKERLRKAGIGSCYPEGKLYASPEQFDAVAAMLSEFDYEFHACAEPKLLKYSLKHGKPIKQSGCISQKDLELMGLTSEEGCACNNQNRTGCLCLSCKTELLTAKKQCPHKCIYCYWKTDADR